MIKFTVHGQAQTAGSKRSFVPVNKKTGQPFRRENGGIVVNTVDDNPKSKDWKTVVACEARRHYQGPLLTGPLRLTLEFVVVRPKSHFGVKGLRPSAPLHPTVKPDVLKLTRAVEDALTAVVWRDDAQIVEEHLFKSYGESACVRVIVAPLSQAEPTDAVFAGGQS